MKKKLLILVGIIGVLISCKKNTLFDVKASGLGSDHKISYSPKMDFEVIEDSAYWYFDRKDIQNSLFASVSKGDQIYRSNKFQLVILLRAYRLKNNKEYEFVLRTFSKDFKIIDSYVMASTIGELNCNGVIDGKLNITTTCADGTVTTATVDEYGKFIINE